MAALGRRGVLAVKWSAVATLARFALQFAAQVVLARTLGPELFGVFGIGMVVLTFATFVSGFGFGWSLLQRAELRDQDIRFAWTWQLLFGCATALAVYLAAPWLADYFREPRARSVIEWLSLACLLNAAAAPATYLLQRDLNFRAAGLIQVLAYACGYLVVGVPMALSGWGTASLVAACLVQGAVSLVASYAARPHPVRPLFWYSDGRGAFGTGRAVALTNIVNWSLNNLDRVVIGRLLDAQAFGLYNAAYNLATLPNALLLGALQPAFLAAGARLQDEPQRLGRAYLQMIATVLVVGLPVFASLALMSNDLVRLLYGSRWVGAGPVLALLFLSIPAYVVWGLSTPVLWNTGRKNHEYALQLPLVALGALAFWSLGGRGIVVAAAIAGALLLARALVIGTAAFRALGLRATLLAPDLARGLALAALCACGAWLGQQAMAPAGLALLSLAAATFGAALPGLMILLLRPAWLGEHTVGMVLRFAPALGRLLRPGAVAAAAAPDLAAALDGSRP
ncbi:MAG: lipopolysaccharide biosynthesis protein [Comamonadaceae bacterium]|nr:MAG: lipopolysaccharide biosynthesis protein [Comamonadaceae bacterium]